MHLCEEWPIGVAMSRSPGSRVVPMVDSRSRPAAFCRALIYGKQGTDPDTRQAERNSSLIMAEPQRRPLAVACYKPVAARRKAMPLVPGTCCL